MIIRDNIIEITRAVTFDFIKIKPTINGETEIIVNVIIGIESEFILPPANIIED